jgi:predicted acetyltransferase
MSIEGLAGLYTGHTSPFALALRGQLQGEEPALRALGHAFAGPAPGMPDFF